MKQAGRPLAETTALRDRQAARAVLLEIYMRTSIKAIDRGSDMNLHELWKRIWKRDFCRSEH